MESLLIGVLAVISSALVLLAFIPALRAALAWRGDPADRSGRGRLRPRSGGRLRPERAAAELRAEELMGTVVGADGLASYRALGFLYSFGDPEGDGRPGYGYLIYPHRPIVSFDARSGRLLNELCVSFPDRSEPGAAKRLPDADDVLAKWMAIRGDELGLLAEANLHPPGRQVDPEQARRDIVRLGEWTASPSDTSAPGGFATAQ